MNDVRGRPKLIMTLDDGMFRLNPQKVDWRGATYFHFIPREVLWGRVFRGDYYAIWKSTKDPV